MHTFRLITALLLAAIGTSCSSDFNQSVSQGVGSLTVTLKSQTHLLLPDGTPSDVPVPQLPGSSATSFTLSADAGGYTHTWDNFDNFPQGEEYFSGTYTMSAICGTERSEGFDSPTFTGSAQAIISEGNRTDTELVLAMRDAAVKVNFGNLTDGTCTLRHIAFITPGGIFHRYSPQSQGLLCLNTGRVSIFAEVETDIPSRGRTTLPISLGNIQLNAGGTLYTFSANLQQDGLTVTAPGFSVSRRLDNLQQQAEAAPHITPAPGTLTDFTLPEGELPAQGCALTATPSKSPLAHIYLSISSPVLASATGIPAFADLLNLTDEQRTAFASLGLNPALTPAQGGTVDLAQLLGHLVYLTPDKALSVFTLIAVDQAGNTSAPAEIRVTTAPVDIEILSTEPAVMGIDRSAIIIKCPSANFASHVEVMLTDSRGNTTPAQLTVEPLPDNTWRVSFAVTEGSEPIKASILYCSEERAAVSIPRQQPGFIIEADPFARGAVLRVVADDPDLRPVITENLNIYVNDSEYPVYNRDPENGLINLIGLEPSSTYRFKATMMEDVESPDFCPAVTARTEATAQLHNADFEERTNGVIFPSLPSGGRYSQTTVEIFNWQHHTTYEQEVPKGWANTNAKTFCKKAANHNTWYMQPSVSLTRTNPVSGSFAVEISSVAFDLNGPDIPDYAQTGKPYLDYSPIVPHIACRAAGKLFLGSYSFNPATMQETYNEGINFSSRPRSLNGYYRFMPSQADRSARGAAFVELLGIDPSGNEITIARGVTHLPIAGDNTAFTVPLSYDKFGIKATRIKVMFSSSAVIGTIADETAAIATWPDPVTATSIGGRLWIDNITLAY